MYRSAAFVIHHCMIFLSSLTREYLVAELVQVMSKKSRVTCSGPATISPSCESAARASCQIGPMRGEAIRWIAESLAAAYRQMHTVAFTIVIHPAKHALMLSLNCESKS